MSDASLLTELGFTFGNAAISDASIGNTMTDNATFGSANVETTFGAVDSSNVSIGNATTNNTNISNASISNTTVSNVATTDADTTNDFVIIPLSPPGTVGSVTVNTGSGNDTIVVAFDAHASAPLIHANGGRGDDWFDTSTLNASPATVIGGPGNDTLIGGAFVPDTLIGSSGSDTIWMGGGDHIGADGSDRLLLDARAGSGTIDIQGATNTTIFDFSSLSPLHLESPVGPIALPDPFVITRSDLTFDAAGNLMVDHGDYHATLTGFPYHESASLDAAIAAGHVILAATT